jgi:hypothetical protein
MKAGLSCIKKDIAGGRQTFFDFFLEHKYHKRTPNCT